MKIQILRTVLALLVGLTMFSCDSKPKVIESNAATNQAESNAGDMPSMEEVPTVVDSENQQHKVVVEEVLDTDKYSYIRVMEDGEEFWIAISKRDVEVGKTYYYKGGLLKKNFHSREFNRVFETVYLVSQFWEQPNGGSALNEAIASSQQSGGAPILEVGNIEPAPGAIKLSELFANKEKYQNQKVKVTGKVVKVNPMIMNRNWVHVQDGSGDSLDLTITTTEKVSLGAVVTLEGVIALDKDFGAGYRYDIIMEGAVVQ